VINKRSIENYIRKLFGEQVHGVTISRLGAGVQGAGFLVEVATDKGTESYVIKGLFPEGLEHDYPSDRAGVFLLDLEQFGGLPKHVKAIDVLSEMENGEVKSIGGGKEYYLLMEKAEGKHYFQDLSDFAVKEELTEADIEKIRTMAFYLAGIHAKKKDSRPLYWRKVRDTIGHGECLMGVFDTYPDGTISYEEMADIEKKCIDWRARLKPKFRRLCQVHGDFHPGNIWFQDDGDILLLDRSRGPWGDAADDVTALSINYIFFSIHNFGRVQGPYLEALRLFFSLYIHETGDDEIIEVVAPFFAFRGAVVANPVFYPDVTDENRRRLFHFVHSVLDHESFDVEKVNEYLQ
jgi:aminoglycoside phosphotransferase (APT) family kinase protein